MPEALADRNDIDAISDQPRDVAVCRLWNVISGIPIRSASSPRSDETALGRCGRPSKLGLRRRPEKAGRAREVWVRIPGKYRNRDSAWDALEDLMATRH
jgi:hypothetical protein